MSVDEFISSAKDDIEIKKHIRHSSFLGGGYFEKVSDTSAISRRQVMTVHLHHTGEDHAETDGSYSVHTMRGK